MLSTAGVFFMSASALILVWNLATSFFRGKVAGDNPWDAWTLEWATTSPPPHENFVALPPIRSRRPLWDLANPDRPDPIVGENSAAVTLPNHNKVGILSFILSEAGFFAALILAYLYFYARPQAGPGPKELDVPRTLVFSVCLFASSFTFWRSEVALDETASRFHAWLARADDPARRCLPCWSGNGVLETISDRGRSQHQYLLNHLLHSNWLPRFARASWFDRAVDFSLAGVGG